MKTVQDKDGNVVEVADNTPCHAGKNGALPVALDEVLDADVLAEIAARDVAYTAEAPERVKKSIIKYIAALELEITPRRIREAILGIDNGWLTTQDALITTERNKL